MRPRALLLLLLTQACAAQSQPMHVLTEAEQWACEAQGGTIEPAHALNEYVCLLPSPPPAP
jgi:hypothetical protein